MKKLILILTAVVFAVSCSDNLEDLNQDIKNPTSVNGESLFASAQKALADQITTPNVNLNNQRLWAQHWQETTYPDESRYDQVTRSIPDNHWAVMYRDVLRDLLEAKRVIEDTDNDLTNALKPNKLAIVEILTVYAFSNLVETYGDIPYSEALDIENLLPAYDDGETVYKDLLTRLSAAIGNLNTSLGSYSSADDLMYAGDVASWKKFGNTLKLRMAMTLADVDPSTSKAAAESAVSSGVFSSNADTGAYMYSDAAPNNNPVNDNLVLSGRNDYVAGKTLVDNMNANEDPRREAYFTLKDGQYIGGEIGAQTVYSDYSHVADPIKEAARPGVLLSYIEAEFLMAEGAARGYNMGGDAESHYVAGITASFDYWGVSGLADFLARPEIDYTTAVANSPSNPQWKSVIGTQSWVANYDRSFANYLSIRRLDYPILVEPINAETGYPTRYTYPVSEQNLNPTNYAAAASAIGGDLPVTRLFWDMFYTFDF